MNEAFIKLLEERIKYKEEMITSYKKHLPNYVHSQFHTEELQRSIKETEAIIYELKVIIKELQK